MCLSYLSIWIFEALPSILLYKNKKLASAIDVGADQGGGYQFKCCICPNSSVAYGRDHATSFLQRGSAWNDGNDVADCRTRWDGLFHVSILQICGSFCERFLLPRIFVMGSRSYAAGAVLWYSFSMANTIHSRRAGWLCVS